jgi:hypothetical protein
MHEPQGNVVFVACFVRHVQTVERGGHDIQCDVDRQRRATTRRSIDQAGQRFTMDELHH